MKVYEKYLASEIVTVTVMVLISLLVLFGFFDFVGELQNLGRGKYDIWHLAAYVLLSLPGRIYELAPIAVLIGSLFALSQLGRRSEIVVLRSAGLSASGLLVALVKLGLVFSAVIFLVGEFVTPPAEKKAQQIRLNAMSSMVVQDFRSGLWLRDGKSFINIGTVLPDATMANLRIYQFDDDHRLFQIVDASTASYKDKTHWQLKDVKAIPFDVTSQGNKYFPEMVWETALTSDMLAVTLVSPDKMTLHNLYLYIRHLSGNHQETNRYEIAFWKKLVYPASILVMMVLALPFGFLQSRGGGVGVKVFAGIMLGIGFHLLNGLTSSLGAINQWPPLLAAMIPSGLFLAGAYLMFWHIERR